MIHIELLRIGVILSVQLLEHFMFVTEKVNILVNNTCDTVSEIIRILLLRKFAAITVVNNIDYNFYCNSKK